MTRPVFSVVCVYNNRAVLDNWLLKGLEAQAPVFELLLVDNTGGKFKSAAEGLNHGGARATGEYIVFIHQDVLLIDPLWLRLAEAFLRKLPDLGAAGVAGMVKGGRGGLFRTGTFPVENRACFVYHGNEREIIESGNNSAEPIEVQTLDEQLLIVPTAVFRGCGFDAETCSGWHLYGVDYSLSARARGLKIYTLPVPVWHMSAGTLDGEYYRTLRKIIKKHRAERMLYTTCGLWYTSLVLNILDLCLFAVKGEFGYWLGRNDSGAGPYLDRIKMLL